MFGLSRLFRRKPKPSDTCSVYICGHLYTRMGDDIVCFLIGSKDPFICDLSHNAPNGVPIQQIACALAAIEGQIQVRIGTVADRPRNNPHYIGLN